jgi:hypothetical protein
MTQVRFGGLGRPHRGRAVTAYVAFAAYLDPAVSRTLEIPVAGRESHQKVIHSHPIC